MNTNTLWQSLDAFKTGSWPANYPANIKRFYSPIDNIHGAVLALIKSATTSLYVSFFGFDDPEICTAICDKCRDADIVCQISLDKTQASGKAEVPLVKELENTPNTNVVTGTSKNGLINHVKMIVVDGTYLICGSTNFSKGGEGSGDGLHGQNNEMSIINDVVIAQEAIKIIELEHQTMQAKLTHS